MLIFNSASRDWIHSISAERLAKLLYSASALDLATKVCFLDHREMRFGPRYTQAPEVERLLSGFEAHRHHKTQSEIEAVVMGQVVLEGCDEWYL